MATRKIAREVKPVAAAAAQTLESGTARIADEARTQVKKGESSANVTASVVTALGTKGHALAEMVVKTVNDHGTSWNRFYADLLALAPEGRRTFRQDLEGVIKAERKEKVYVGLDGKPVDKSVTGNITRSTLARLSEFVTISKALDASVPMDKGWAFSVAVAMARDGLRAQGSGDNRGRKPKTLEERLIGYLISDKKEANGEVFNYVRDLGDSFIDVCRKAVKAYEKAQAEAAAAKEDKPATEAAADIKASVKRAPRKNATPAKTKGRTIRPAPAHA